MNTKTKTAPAALHRVSGLAQGSTGTTGPVVGAAFLSVCSGIEAASVAWNPLGWKAIGFSEVESFPCAVLAHHYPNVRNFGDLTQWENWIDDVADFDVLCGGTPCQGFSVAGKRGGMDDARSQLAWDFLGIADRRKPRWIFWENVPGVLSSDGWRDFGAFLGELGKCGYGFAYRVLDAQYFGLAQRRKRVFVVGYLGDWRPAAAVLLEPESLRGDFAPSREAGEGTAAEPAKSFRGRSNASHREDSDNYVAATLSSQPPSRRNGGSDPTAGHFIAHSLRAEGHDASEDGTGRGAPLVPDVSPALKQRDYKGPSSDGDGDGSPLIPCCFDPNQITSKANRSVPAPGVSHPLPGQPNAPVAFNLRGREGGAMPEQSDVASVRAASGGSSRSYVAATAVRRLTPRECERLQGFPDDYTLVPHRGKPAADGPRYKALGNSWAVPVVRWIGERMAMVTELAGSAQ